MEGAASRVSQLRHGFACSQKIPATSLCFGVQCIRHLPLQSRCKHAGCAARPIAAIARDATMSHNLLKTAVATADDLTGVLIKKQQTQPKARCLPGWLLLSTEHTLWHVCRGLLRTAMLVVEHADICMQTCTQCILTIMYPSCNHDIRAS